ncbi:MAG: hypothetical protein Q9161_004533 [Pseudevernia consocians]
MPTPHPHIPPAPEPLRKTFDPWNSSSTGHQRADNRLAGSTSWRASRTLKLGHQFRAGEGGGQRVFDTVGAGSRDFGTDGRKENGGWEKGAPGLRPKGWRDVGLMLGQGSQAELERQDKEKPKRKREDDAEARMDQGDHFDKSDRGNEKAIFTGLCVYINGSTAPAIGDHKLKHLLAEHGAHVSIALGRRSVTHVIVGKPNDGRGGGAGGGLAGSKIQKEILRVRGKGVKFVGVEWVIESVKAGKRLSEARFQGVSIAPRGVGSVYGLFKKEEKGMESEDTENDGRRTKIGEEGEEKGE